MAGKCWRNIRCPWWTAMRRCRRPVTLWLAVGIGVGAMGRIAWTARPQGRGEGGRADRVAAAAPRGPSSASYSRTPLFSGRASSPLARLSIGSKRLEQ